MPDAPTDRDRRVQAAWAALKGAATVLFARISASRPPRGAQPGLMGYLHALAQADRPLTPGALAKELDVTPATVTGALTALEDAGLVERRRGTGDRRAVQVVLTPEGRAARLAWVDTIVQHLREGLAPLSDQELATLTALLEKVGPPIHGPPRGLMLTLRHDATSAQPAKPAKAAKAAGGRPPARARRR